jgi:ABC-2 type transport system permease protein
MRNTLAITKKELTAYFTTPVAYVVFAAMTILGSWFFLSLLGEFQRQSFELARAGQVQVLQQYNLTDMVMVPLVLNLAVVLLISVPFLTMRLLSEEMKQGTMELLLTTPVRPIEIVLGKYLAALAILTVALALTLSYPLLLTAFGTGERSPVEWPTVLAGYLGLFLLGAGAMSLGLFISSLTQSQIVAAFLTLMILLLTWVVGWKAGDVEGAAREVLLYLSSTQHMVSFARGLLALEDVVYYASYVVLGLFLTHRAVEGQRWTA